jgi:hypothetical protein
MKIQKTLALVALVASPLALALATVAVPKLAAVLLVYTLTVNFVIDFFFLGFGLALVGGLATVFGFLSQDGGVILIA